MAVRRLHGSQAPEVNEVKSLHHFYVCDPGLPPCLGYDLFEVVACYDLAMYLKYLVKQKKWFSYLQLNWSKKANELSESCDANSVPCEISQKNREASWPKLVPFWSSPSNNIENKIANSEDGVWKQIILLREIVELICAHKIDSLPQHPCYWCLENFRSWILWSSKIFSRDWSLKLLKCLDV